MRGGVNNCRRLRMQMQSHCICALLHLWNSGMSFHSKRTNSFIQIPAFSSPHQAPSSNNSSITVNQATPKCKKTFWQLIRNLGISGQKVIHQNLNRLCSPFNRNQQCQQLQICERQHSAHSSRVSLELLYQL